MKRIVEPSGDTPLCWSSVTFRAGSAGDPVGLEGLCHHAFELARRGAGGRTRAEIDEQLDGLGASVWTSSGRDSVTFSALCLSRHLDEVWRVMCDVVAAPAMADDEHDQLLRETRRDLDGVRDDDAAVAARLFSRHCLPGYPYARTALGTDASLAAIDAEAARDEVRRSTARGGAIYGFAGDIDDSRVQQLASALSRRLADGDERPQPDLSPPAAPPGRRLIIVDKPERTQSQVLVGHLGAHGGSEHAIALLAVETTFGGMFTSRLMQTIRVENGWSYGAGCRTYRARGRHWFRISMAPAAEVTTDALRTALAMYEQLCADGITADELAFAKDYLIGGMPFSRATAKQRLRRKIRELVCELPDGFDAQLADKLRAVTLADTKRAIAGAMTPNELCVVVVCTAERLQGELEGLGGWSSVSVEDFEGY